MTKTKSSSTQKMNILADSIANHLCKMRSENLQREEIECFDHSYNYVEIISHISDALSTQLVSEILPGFDRENFEAMCGVEK